MNSELEEKLALLIICRGDRFANSYGLIKVLWSFFNFSSDDLHKIIKRVEAKGLVTKEVIDQMGYYELSVSGRRFVNENHESTIEVLKQNFPKRIEMLESFYSCMLDRASETLANNSSKRDA